MRVILTLTHGKLYHIETHYFLLPPETSLNTVLYQQHPVQQLLPQALLHLECLKLLVRVLLPAHVMQYNQTNYIIQ